MYELQENSLEDLEEWIEVVKMALPSIQNIRANKRDDDGYCYLQVIYDNGMEVPSSSLSHGTLHIFALTILPYLNDAPKVITLEEPENGIHPKAIDAVLEALDCAPNTQLFMSTHSPTVLAHTEIENIITLRFDDEGATQVLKGREHPALVDWKGDLDLGTLFAAGIFE